MTPELRRDAETVLMLGEWTDALTVQAAVRLARHYLAESDDQLADGPWLETVGFKEVSEEGAVPVKLRWLNQDRSLGVTVRIGLDVAEVALTQAYLNDDPTRGQILHLLAALGSPAANRETI